MRLDKYIAEKFALTRNRAQFCIDSGLVLVNTKFVQKTSYGVREDDLVEMIEDKKSWFVARSAVKLDDFIRAKNIDVSGKTGLDVGASTGGFTQVLLQHGAKQVVAVDVGTSQLHESLRTDPRVISRENCDIRTATFEEIFDLVVVDVSFISLRKIIPSLQKILSKDSRLILLFKPQFEVWRQHLRKTWVPRDEKIIKQSLDDFCAYLRELGFVIQDVRESTLPGEAGNREWLIWCKN